MLEIILDVDGVIARCHEGALDACGCGVTPYPLNQRVKNVCEMQNPYYERMSHDEFWGGFSYEFWRDLERADYWESMWEYFDRRFGNENIFVATRPTINPQCAAGKTHWLEKHLPKSVGGYALIKKKEMLAKPNRLMIDDSPQNIARFEAAGGWGFLWRQPWNGTPVLTWSERELELESYFESGLSMDCQRRGDTPFH